MYPLKMSPYIKETVWGGNNLKIKYNKSYDFEKAGESWEISAHSSGLSVIGNGVLKGKTFKEAISEFPEICGNSGGDFPLMFKIIDANSDLSIQVHPDDYFAEKLESVPFGKTEMWYIIDCVPNAKLGIGFNRSLTDEEIKLAIEEGTLEEYINYVSVEKGDIFFIPAGTVHCMCSGVLVAELQQSSDITYRLYDYNRKDKNGNLRELCVDKSLAVMNKDAKPIKLNDGVKCEKFQCFPVKCPDVVQDTVPEKYQIIFFAEGNGKICYSDGSESFSAGDTFVLPQNMGEYTISGNCVYLKCTE